MEKFLESDYGVLGLANDIFISPVKYYFSPKGFGLVLSKDVLIISGKNKEAVRNELLRSK